MTLEQKDFELIERIIRKTCDDVLLSIDRGLDRVEERVDGAESRIYTRINGLEENDHDTRQAIVDVFDSLREDIREINRAEF